MITPTPSIKKSQPYITPNYKQPLQRPVSTLTLPKMNTKPPITPPPFNFSMIKPQQHISTSGIIQNKVSTAIKYYLPFVLPIVAPILPGIASVLTTHPLDAILINQQTHGKSITNTFNDITNNKKNPFNLLKGILPPIIATIPQRSGQVFIREASLNPIEYAYRYLTNKSLDDRTNPSNTTQNRFSSYSNTAKLLSAVCAALPDSGSMVFSEIYKIPDQLGITRPKLTPNIIGRVFAPLAIRDSLSSISAFTLGAEVSTKLKSIMGINDSNNNFIRDLSVKIVSTASAVMVSQPIITPFDNIKTLVASNPERTYKEIFQILKKEIGTEKPVLNTIKRLERGLKIRMALVPLRTGIAIGGASAMLDFCQNLMNGKKGQ